MGPQYSLQTFFIQQKLPNATNLGFEAVVPPPTKKDTTVESCEPCLDSMDTMTRVKNVESGRAWPTKSTLKLCRMAPYVC